MKVKLKKIINNSYNIDIKNGNYKNIPNILNSIFNDKECVMITDSKVDELYGEELLKRLKLNNIECLKIVFPEGEQNKNRETKKIIEDTMQANKITRSSYIIALGGGVTGDLAGYIAATYMRGIPFIQIPTTLLSQVDSSVGGKTGIDTEYGKNLIGAFYQPKMVIIDPEFLLTLDEDNYLSGLGEILKHAVMFDRQLFKILQNNNEKILKKDPIVMKDIIKTNCAIKASVVQKDEKEQGMRKLLNFGHTVGHAIEQESNYSIPHGIAVMIGICIEIMISEIKELINNEDAEKIISLMLRYLPKKYINSEIDKEKVVKRMAYDKKNIKNKIFFAIPKKIGIPLKKKNKYAQQIEEEYILKGIEKFNKEILVN